MLTRDRHAPATTLVAEAGPAEVVGFVDVTPLRDDGAPPGIGEVTSLYVHPQPWGNGAGQALDCTEKDDVVGGATLTEVR